MAASMTAWEFTGQLMGKSESVSSKMAADVIGQKTKMVHIND